MHLPGLFRFFKTQSFYTPPAEILFRISSLAGDGFSLVIFIV